MPLMGAAAIAAARTASARALAIRGVGTAAVKGALGLESDKEKEQPLHHTVSSSAISAISWQPNPDTITVLFRRGGSYDYPGSRDLYLDFVSAPSIGQYFNAHIR